MRCASSSDITSFPWLVSSVDLLSGSIFHKRTKRWTWQGSTSALSWNWHWCYCRSILVSAVSVLLLFFSDDRFRLRFESVEYDLQRDFARLATEADLFYNFGTAVGCLSWEAWWPVTGSMGRAILLPARPCWILLWVAWTSSAGVLSTKADFPVFSEFTAASTSSRIMGWSSSLVPRGLRWTGCWTYWKKSDDDNRLTSSITVFIVYI